MENNDTKHTAPEPQIIIIDGDEEIELDSDGMEVRSDDEEPTQSDLDFIAPDDEVEAEILLSQTVSQEIEDTVQNELHELGEFSSVEGPRLCRQCTCMAYNRDLDAPDEDEDDEDYVPPDSGDDADYSDDELSPNDEV